jgi:hypothetical protein
MCTAAVIAARLGPWGINPALADVYALDGDDICIGGQGKKCTGRLITAAEAYDFVRYRG